MSDNGASLRDRATAASQSKPQAASAVPVGIPNALTCNVCGGVAVTVASSSMGAVSWAFCGPCLTKPAEPGCMFEYTYETCGNDVADWVRDMWTWQEGRYVSWDEYAQGIEAGTDETPQAAQPEGREPGPQDAPKGGIA